MLRNTPLLNKFLPNFIAMKNFLIFILICANLNATTITELLLAIEKVESGGDTWAYNASEDALGCLQIRPIMLADYNRMTGENIQHFELVERELSFHVATTIFLFYSKRVDGVTPKHLAFLWNGGFDGMKRASNPKRDQKQENLEVYWSKVKKYL